MKFKVLCLTLFFTSYIFSQSDIYYFKDSSRNLTYKAIKEIEFLPVENQILEPYSKSAYWFKIPKKNTSKKYVFHVKTIDTYRELAYQNNNEIDKDNNQRYLVYNIDRSNDTYIKIESEFKSYFNFDLIEESKYHLYERTINLYNGFYYGFSFLVILYAFVYFNLFKDKAYLYYALLLLSITTGFIVIDGTLNLFNITKDYLQYIIILNYVLLAYSAYKFLISFLFLEGIFPKLKKVAYTIGVFIVLSGIMFLFTKHHKAYLILNCLVFLIMLMYWTAGLIIFKRNVYTKIFVFAYAIILFSGIDNLVLTNFGISVSNINPLQMKIGGIVQILILWFAVFYREKILRKENSTIKKEIVKYIKLIENNKEEKENSEELIKTLSIRERQIFDLVLKGYSNKEIAFDTNISVNTVKFHVKNIYEKLNVKSRKEVLNIQFAK